MELDIVCFSDSHGNLDGLGRAAALLAELRREHSNLVVIDNGDSIQGSPTVHYYSNDPDRSLDHPYVRAMEMLGADFAVPGNHDFDYGVRTLRNVIGRSPFQWLAANVFEPSSGASPFLEYAVRDIGSLRVGFTGATTRLPMWKDAENVEPLRFSDEVEALGEAVFRLREQEKVDFIVVCYHGGFEPEGDASDIRHRENQARRLLGSVEGIDLLITGHQHRRLIERFGDTLVVQPGSGADALARVTVEFRRRERGWACHHKEAELLEVAERKPDPAFLAALEPYRLRSADWLESPLCRLHTRQIFVDLIEEVCMAEHGWVQWMHDVQKRASGVEISAVTIKNPAFTTTDALLLRRRDILEFFPYPDRLCVALLSGEQILASIEISASFFDRSDTGGVSVHAAWREPHLLIYQYLMWDGIDYELDLCRPQGSRVAHCLVRGEPIERSTRYPVVMTQYIKNTASKYPHLRNAPVVWRMERDFADLLIQDAAAREVLDVEVDRNWSVRR